jgi:hypothetical protein
MGLFTRRRQSLLLTPEAVSAVLGAAGFDPAEVSEGGHALTEGFTAYVVPVTMEDRVGVSWHADLYSYGDQRGNAESALVECAAALMTVGYQCEFVAELASDYLVVWLEGEF